MPYGTNINKHYSVEAAIAEAVERERQEKLMIAELEEQAAVAKQREAESVCEAKRPPVVSPKKGAQKILALLLLRLTGRS